MIREAVEVVFHCAFIGEAIGCVQAKVSRAAALPATFAQHGLKVRRLEGFDWERGTYRSTLGGTMARKSEILMKYMHKVWIPAQIAALKKDPREEHKVGAPDSGRVAAVTLVLYRPVMIAEECGRTPLARVGQDFCQVYPLLHPAIVLDP